MAIRSLLGEASEDHSTISRVAAALEGTGLVTHNLRDCRRSQRGANDQGGSLHDIGNPISNERFEPTRATREPTQDDRAVRPGMNVI